MKYTKDNPPEQCFLTQSSWYNSTITDSTPVGVLWHDTDGGESHLKRYVQPSDDATDRDYWLEKLGKNKNGNDWNHSGRKAGVNAFIGRLADESIATIQTGDWDMCPFGCGSGEHGSCNGYTWADAYETERLWQHKHWIQFEMCDDGYRDAFNPPDENYFNAMYEEACQLTAYLCDLYNIDPLGTVDWDGVQVPTILCHGDSYDYGVGGNHQDVRIWFGDFSVTMDDARKRVSEILNQTTEIELYDKVKIKPEVTTYASGSKIPQWVKDSILYVREFRGNKVRVSTEIVGDITGTVYYDDLTLIEKHSNSFLGCNNKPVEKIENHIHIHIHIKGNKRKCKLK